MKKQSNDIKVLDVTSFSLNFPPSFENEIPRDNIVDTIKQILEGDNDVLFIDGEDEIGKTVLLTQFAKKFNSQTISCFIKPVNNYSQSLDSILLDLIRQLHWLIYSEEFNGEIYDFQTLQKYCLKLQTKKGHSKYYFLFDGFEHIEDVASTIFKEVIDYLPLGITKFKFIISDKPNKLRSKLLKEKEKVKKTDYRLTSFSIDEMEKFLESYNFSKEQIQELKAITLGYPGRLNNIRRELSEGITWEELYDKLGTYKDLLNWQWDKIDFENQSTIKLLALLAHEPEIPLVKVAAILDMTLEEVTSIIEGIRILEIDERGVANFISNTHKRFAIEKLKDWKRQVEEAIINYLITSKENDDAIIELPKRYERIKKYDELLRVLSEENFVNLIQKQESLSFLYEQTSIGIRAAEKEKKQIDFFRFSLIKSSAKEFERADVWENELEALVELNDFNSALNLANSALLREDKLRLLALYAKRKKVKTKFIEQEILDFIRDLYNQIDIAVLGPKLSNIASNLLHVLPELAIELYDKASGSDEVSADLNFARLAFTAKKISNEAESDNTFDKISGRIKDPKLKHITDTISSLFSGATVNEVIEQVKKLSSPNDQIQLLRIWIGENLKHSEIGVIVDFALDIVIRGTSDVPLTASILKDFSAGIARINEELLIRKLVGRFDSLNQLAKEKGPTVDYIKLQLNLAWSEYIVDYHKCRNRLYDVLQEVYQIGDFSIKTECLSVFLASIMAFDKNDSLEKEDGFRRIITEELIASYHLLLEQSANHYVVAKKVIENISVKLIDLGIDFCKKLNTRYRRDFAFSKATLSYLKNDIGEVDFNTIEKLYQNIFDPKIKNNLIIDIIEHIASLELDIKPYIPSLINYISRIKLFLLHQDKIYAFVSLISILYKDKSNYAQQIDSLKAELYQTWDNIDSDWEKVDIGFTIASLLAKDDAVLARFYLDASVAKKHTNLLDSPSSVELYINCVRVSIRAFSGLIRSKSYTDQDISELNFLINGIPSTYEKLIISNEFLLLIHSKEDDALFRSYFEKHFKQELEGFLENPLASSGDRINLITSTAPTLYIFNNQYAKHLIENYGGVRKDFAYNSICKLLITRELPFEPYDDKGYDYKISYETALEVCDLLSYISTDSVINIIIDTIRISTKKSRLSLEQIHVIKQKLDSIIDTKFPDLNNITHDGYKILSQVYVYKIAKNNIPDVWKNLVNDAKKIPNISDRAFVLSHIAKNLPESLKNLSRYSVLMESLNELDSINTYIGRVERYEDLKSIIKEINPELCKQRLRLAISDSLQTSSASLYSTQKDLIDFAYDFDESLAEELIKLIDNDPARMNVSRAIKRHVNILKIRDLIRKDKKIDDTKDFNELAEAAYLFLRKLNSGRYETKHLDNFSDWLMGIGNLPLSKSSPLISGYIQNAVLRLESDSNSAKSTLRPIFKSCLINTRVIKVLMLRRANKNIRPKDFLSREESTNHILISPGERQKAIDTIKNWLSNQSASYIKICDPYFSPQDIELLKVIKSCKPHLHVDILTGINKTDLSELYHQEWENICDEDAPDTEITIVGTRRKNNPLELNSPNHDRWWITDKAGLRVGTSFNSLGVTKNSEISFLAEAEAKKIEAEFIDKYLLRIEKFHNTEKLIFSTITM